MYVLSGKYILSTNEKGPFLLVEWYREYTVLCGADAICCQEILTSPFSWTEIHLISGDISIGKGKTHRIRIKVLIINNLVLIVSILLNIFSYTLIYICGVVITCFSCAILSQLNRTT